MRLHDHAASGNCYKARLLLSLLAIAYERVEVDIFAGDTLTDEYAALNPVRETPVLELDDGTTIAQSNAILAYLAHGTAYLPEDRLEQAQVHQWLAFEQERVMGGIGGPRFRRLTGRPEIPGRLATGREALAVLDEHLERRAWLVGDGPTIADVSVFAYAHVAPDAGLEVPTAAAAWMRRLRELDGFVDDLVLDAGNACPTVSRSIYD
jgi:glutathione S-transferase